MHKVKLVHETGWSSCTPTFSYNLSLADLYLVMICWHLVDRRTVQYFWLEHDAWIRFIYAAQQKTFRLFRSAGHNDLERTFGYISLHAVYRSRTRNRRLRSGIRGRATLSSSKVSILWSMYKETVNRDEIHFFFFISFPFHLVVFVRLGTNGLAKIWKGFDVIDVIDVTDVGSVKYREIE